MKIYIALITVALLFSCSAKKNNATISESTYGYTQKNPIKVGGDLNGPVNERKYLNSLSGPNGERVFFNRQGSCCPFDSKNSSFGGGMLDKYSVYYEGIKDTATFYINMYDKERLKAPIGFKFKN